MKISSVKVDISQEDLLDILREVIVDYLDIEFIDFTEVVVDNYINIKGRYLGKVKVPFEACLEVCDVANNMIKLKIVKIKVAKIKVFNFIKNFALKKSLDRFKNYGIFVDKGYIVIAMDKLNDYIPIVKINIVSIDVSNNINVELKNLNVDLKNLNSKDKEEHSEKNTEECREESKIEEETVITKKQDSYTEFRKDLTAKIPKKYEKIAKYAMVLPDLIALFVRLFKDERVDNKVKTQLALIIAYLTSPIDILPDFIPIIGKIDDVTIAFLGLNKLLNNIPENVILENWQGEDDVISITREGVYYITNVIGADKVSKVLTFLNPKGMFKKNKKDSKDVKEEKEEIKSKNKYVKNKKERCKHGMDK